MKKKTTLDFSDYKATTFEKAVSIGVAHSLMCTVNPTDIVSMSMAIANGFTTGIAFARKNFTPTQLKALEKEYADLMKRIEESDRMTMKGGEA